MSRGLGRIGRLMLRLAAVAGLATCLSMGAAKAVTFAPIEFGPGDSNVTFLGLGGPGNLLMTLLTSTGPASFANTNGMFTLSAQSGGQSYSLGNFSDNAFSVLSGPPEPFTYAGAGNSLTGNVTWTSITDNDPKVNTLFGTFLVTMSDGSPDFKSSFPDGFNTSVQWQIIGDGTTTLIQLSQSLGATLALPTDSGVIDPVPGPIVGASLPGLIFAGAGLLGWLRRKRNQRYATDSPVS